ncbi:ferredoxin--NADP reductase [uncultured Arthrobacter sp.]|uniref:ferredoxin--NADP reductase n=1 Tax=uncultured Arthrobacter sp. TaxID=114050 RepID=UPI002626DEB1|nr:FAD-dependent oxidoreductase [uncultured Arthrobacter sp.]
MFKTTLLERRQVAEGTLELAFKRPEKFAFHAGQYLQLRLPKLLYRDRRGASRVFSIASSPADKERIIVAYRDTGSGFKQTLRESRIGSEVIIEGPHGFHLLPRQPARPVVLIAGGIGITSFMSMLRLNAERDEVARPHITLLYVNRSQRSAAYLDELKHFEKKSARLTVKTNFGIIDEKFISTSVKNKDQCLWYIAGPPFMVESAQGALEAMGVDSGRIYCEEFPGY